MPSDVFETVVDILDPELNIGSEANFDDDALLAKRRRKGESMTAEHGDHSMADLTTEQPTPTQITQVGCLTVDAGLRGISLILKQ